MANELEVGRPATATVEAPKARVTKGPATTATMEELVERLEDAFYRVESNKGAPGPDRQSIKEVRERLGEILPKLAKELLAGTYQPGMIRRVWIPKSGGQRGLDRCSKCCNTST